MEHSRVFSRPQHLLCWVAVHLLLAVGGGRSSGVDKSGSRATSCSRHSTRIILPVGTRTSDACVSSFCRTRGGREVSNVIRQRQRSGCGSNRKRRPGAFSCFQSPLNRRFLRSDQTFRGSNTNKVGRTRVVRSTGGRMPHAATATTDIRDTDRASRLSSTTLRASRRYCIPSHAEGTSYVGSRAWGLKKISADEHGLGGPDNSAEAPTAASADPLKVKLGKGELEVCRVINGLCQVSE